MHGLTILAFAAVTGITVIGIAGSLMELATAQRLGFREPFFGGRHLPRSLLSAAAAGPLMLLNDALAARSQGRISPLALASCAFTALVWSTATGIVVLGLVGRMLVAGS